MMNGLEHLPIHTCHNHLGFTDPTFKALFYLGGGFKFQPILKICSSNWILFPKVRGENHNNV